MYKFLLLICFIASVVAFSPRATSNARSTMIMMAERSKSMPFLIKPSKLDGSMAGDEGFDPLGLSNINDLGVDLYWLREAELKHARVAMLAVTGAVAQELGVVFPGLPTGKNQIDLFWTCLETNPGPLFAGFIFLGMVELFSGYAITEGRKSGDRQPGDFGITYGSEKDKKSYALKEIRNGRLAMWAAAGILMQGATTGQGAVENLFNIH